MSEEAKQVAPLAVQRDVTIANAKQIGEPAVAATSRAGGNERHSEPLAPQLRSIGVGEHVSGEPFVWRGIFDLP